MFSPVDSRKIVSNLLTYGALVLSLSIFNKSPVGYFLEI
jgi:hypothetical protein